MLRILTLAALLGVVAVLLLLNPGIRETVLPPVANWLEVTEDGECTRYVIILPGDEVRRSLTAAGLVRIGLAQDVLIPQNPESPDVRDGITLPTAQISRKILQHRGIPLDRIVILPSESRTTFDDALALSAFLEGREGSVSVVTSAFHTRRAQFVFRKVLGAEADRIQTVSAPNPGFSTARWWESREGLRLILTEYVKLAFYWLRYGSLLTWSLIAAVVAGLGWRARHRRRTSEEPMTPRSSGDSTPVAEPATG